MFVRSVHHGFRSAPHVYLQVVELISGAIRDIMCAEFTEFRDLDSTPCLPEKVTLQRWKDFIFLQSGSLLANSCQSAMMLGNHGEDVQVRARNFGTHLALAHQVRSQITNSLIFDLRPTAFVTKEWERNSADFQREGHKRNTSFNFFSSAIHS